MFEDGLVDSSLLGEISIARNKHPILKGPKHEPLEKVKLHERGVDESGYVSIQGCVAIREAFVGEVKCQRGDPTKE